MDGKKLNSKIFYNFLYETVILDHVPQNFHTVGYTSTVKRPFILDLVSTKKLSTGKYLLLRR